jgi:hypothetical protein
MLPFRSIRWIEIGDVHDSVGGEVMLLEKLRGTKVSLFSIT